MDLLKNVIYAGVGLATTTSDKIKETIDDLVEKGKISDTEGKRIIEDFFHSTESKREEFEEKVKKITGGMPFAKKEKEKEDSAELEALRKQVAELKAELEEAKKTPKASTKTTTTKKKTTTKTAE